jgi:hypothetical protein
MNLLSNISFLISLLVILLFIIFYLLNDLYIKTINGKTRSKRLEDLSKQLTNTDSALQEAINDLAITKHENSEVLGIASKEKELKESKALLESEIETLESEENYLREKILTSNDSLNSIKNQLSIFLPIFDLANVGFFEEPEYLFETSDRYKIEIQMVREFQKEMIKNNEAVNVPNSLAMTDNKAYTKKILTGQSKLMLKAFNLECDSLMKLVKPSNFTNTLERINKTATDLEKSSVALKCSFNIDYIELKYKECEFQFQFKLKLEEEREEQAIIREQIREEQKAIKEYERAVAAAEKEERIYRTALDKARLELDKANEEKKSELAKKIEILEMQLKEAEEKEQRAKSLAEQTKKGHVYVISNIGSFGENVYKIGLTRRLDPMDRVKELGDASVPFPFDVHAIIYNDDAPALESKLHREFKYLRVNKVNKRKEFFNVNLEDIKNKVTEITGNDENFKMTAAAENYYESLKLSRLN